MKREKLNLFIGVFLTCSVIYITPFVIYVMVDYVKEYLFYDPNGFHFTPRDYAGEVRDTFNYGLFVAATCALTFAVFDWRKKAESLFYVILSVFVGSELGLASLILYTLANSSSPDEIDYIKIGFHFMEISLWIAAFSVIIGIFIKNFIVGNKNKKMMP